MEITTTVAVLGPLEFVDGKFLGIAQFAQLSDVTQVLGAAPVRMSELDLTQLAPACTGTADPWVIQTGGLTLYFEEVADLGAILTNWTYYGGPVAGFDQLVAPNDIRVGGTRHDLMTAYTEFQDLGDQIEVYQPVALRFGLEGDTIKWFGVIDCALEGE